MTQPIVSPDGAWTWDGTSWQPTTGTGATPPAADLPTSAQTPPAPADSTAPAPATPPAEQQPPGAKVGEIVSVRLDDDTPAFLGLVVGQVEGSTDPDTGSVLRDAGVLAVQLPDATFVPNSALRD